MDVSVHIKYKLITYQSYSYSLSLFLLCLIIHDRQQRMSTIVSTRWSMLLESSQSRQIVSITEREKERERRFRLLGRKFECGLVCYSSLGNFFSTFFVWKYGAILIMMSGSCLSSKHEGTIGDAGFLLTEWSFGRQHWIICCSTYVVWFTKFWGVCT